jgi:glutamate carboxypeptidase
MKITNEYFNQQTAKMLADLTTLVEIESPSHDKAAVDGVGRMAAAWMWEAGAQVEIHHQPNTGDCVLGRWNGADSSARPIMLLAHMDTVWPVGTLAERPVRVEDGKLYGPGALDMKAGIVIALAALRGLQALELAPSAPVNLLCTGDEEIGTHESRALIESLASQSQVVLCLEPAIPGGALKTARKGTGLIHLTARGRSAHAGADHAQGVNAIEEMAHHILALQALTDYSRGTTVNVGKIHGGIASNVVPDTCKIVVDFRVTLSEEVARLSQAVQSIKPHHPQAQVEARLSVNRPPMPRDALMAETFAHVQAIASRYGWQLAEGSAGGASDANFTAALGVPTLDGLGADGEGFHALHEHVVIASLPQRAALLAALLHSW